MPLKISDHGGEPLFYVEQTIPVELSLRDGVMQLDVPSRGLKFDRQSKGVWTLAFETKGLLARKIYIGAHYRDGVIDIKTVHLDSDALDLSGEGQLNLDKNSIEMNINLVAGAKKSIGRIPLLDYVLSGKKKNPSITLSKSGDLKDPNIEHTAFKSFTAYPFNVLKRAVTLPGHLVKTVNQKTGGSSPQDNPAEE